MATAKRNGNGNGSDSKLIVELRTNMVRLEQSVETLAGTVGKMADAWDRRTSDIFDRIESTRKETTNDFRAVFAEIREQEKPKWGTYISAASLILAMFIAIGGAVFQPLRMADVYQEKMLNGLETRTNERLGLIVQHFQQDLTEMDMRLQRETRDLNAAIVQRTDRNERAIDGLIDSLVKRASYPAIELFGERKRE